MLPTAILASARREVSFQALPSRFHEHHAQKTGVTVGAAPLLDLDAEVSTRRPLLELLDDRSRQRGQVDRHAAQLGPTHSREFEQIIDEGAHAPRRGARPLDVAKGLGGGRLAPKSSRNIVTKPSMLRNGERTS